MAVNPRIDGNRVPPTGAFLISQGPQVVLGFESPWPWIWIFAGSDAARREKQRQRQAVRWLRWEGRERAR